MWLLYRSADTMNSPRRGFSLPIFLESSSSQMGSLEALLRLDPLEPAEKKCCSIDTQSALIPTAFFACRKTFFDFSLLSRLNDQLNKYQLQVTFPTPPFPSRPQPSRCRHLLVAAGAKPFPWSLRVLRGRAGPGEGRRWGKSRVLVL